MTTNLLSSSRRRLRLSLLVVACLLKAQCVLGAQLGFEISGMVVDAGGSPLPGVTVTITKPEVGFRPIVTVTDEHGRFRVPIRLSSGEYIVTGELSGLKSVSVPADLTRSDASLRLRMDLASVTESVTVTAEAPLVDVTRTVASVAEDVAFLSAEPTSQSERLWRRVGRNIATFLREGRLSVSVEAGGVRRELNRGAVRRDAVWQNYKSGYRDSFDAVGVVTTAAESNHILITSGDEAMLRQEYADISTALVQSGQVTATELSEIAPQVFAVYFAERATNQKVVRTLSGVVTGLLKVRIPFAWPLAERNTYGLLNIIVPLIADYKIRIDDRNTSDRTIKLSKGPHAVWVKAASHLCAETVVIEPDSTTDFHCPKRTGVPSQ